MQATRRDPVGLTYAQVRELERAAIAARTGNAAALAEALQCHAENPDVIHVIAEFLVRG